MSTLAVVMRRDDGRLHISSRFLYHPPQRVIASLTNHTPARKSVRRLSPKTRGGVRYPPITRRSAGVKGGAHFLACQPLTSHQPNHTCSHHSITMPRRRCDYDCFICWTQCASLCTHGRFRDGKCREGCLIRWNRCEGCEHKVFRCPLCGVKIKTLEYGHLPPTINCDCLPKDPRVTHPVLACRR